MVGPGSLLDARLRRRQLPQRTVVVAQPPPVVRTGCEAVVQTVPVLKTTTGTGIAGECSLSTYPILSVPVLKNSYRYKPLTKVRSPHMPDSICTGSEISTTGTDRWESSASVQWREISLLPEPSNVHPQCSTAKTSLLFDLLSLGECCLSTCR